MNKKLIAGFFLLCTAVFAAATAAMGAELSRVYVNGQAERNGDGTTKETAVKTLDEAYGLLEEGGTIVVCGDTSTGISKPYLAPAKAATFTAEDGAALIIDEGLYLYADTTFRDMHIDNLHSGRAIFANGHTLILDEGLTLTESTKSDTDPYYTGLEFFGGGNYDYYREKGEQFGEGANIIIRSGTYNSINLGGQNMNPVNGENGEPAEISVMEPIRIYITGDVTIRDLYCGWNADLAAENVTYGDTQIIIDGDGVQIDNIWGGNYSVYTAPGVVVRQEGVSTITVNAGNVGAIMAGSQILGRDNTNLQEKVAIHLKGGAVGEVLPGGITSGSGESGKTTDAIERVELHLYRPMEHTKIYSGGDFDEGYDALNDTQSVTTDSLWVYLHDRGTFSGFQTPDFDKTVASEKILAVSGAALSDPVPEGFDGLYLEKGGSLLLQTDGVFGSFASDGDEKNRLRLSPGAAFTAAKTIDDAPLYIQTVDESGAPVSPDPDRVLAHTPEGGGNLLLDTENEALALIPDDSGAWTVRLRQAVSEAAFSGFNAPKAGQSPADTVFSAAEGADYTLSLLRIDGQNGPVAADSLWAAGDAPVYYLCLQAAAGLYFPKTLPVRLTGLSEGTVKTVSLDPTGTQWVVSVSFPALQDETTPVVPPSGGGGHTAQESKKDPAAQTPPAPIAPPAPPTPSAPSAGQTPAGPTLADMPDVQGHWAQNAVAWALEQGLFSGVTPNSFAPDLSVTRGMFVSVLHRLAGTPQNGSVAFADVSKDAYYAGAVQWAAQNQIVSGTAPQTFSPDAPVSREQLTAFLYRYAQAAGLDTSGVSLSLAGYRDAAQVSDWAQLSMGWAVNAGILTGKGGQSLDPKGLATRAEAAAILQRFAERYQPAQ